MAYEILDPGDLRTYIADVDLSAKQFFMVAIVAADNAPPHCQLPAAGGKIAGVVQNTPSTGEAATVAEDGVSKVVCGGTVTAGDFLAAGADGRALTAATGNERVGVALQSGTVGIVIAMELEAPSVGKA